MEKTEALDESVRRGGWQLRVIARSYLRAGDFEQTVKLLKQSLSLNSGYAQSLQSLLMLAIVAHHMDDDKLLEHATSRLPSILSGYRPAIVHYHDRMEIAVLRAEVRKLLGDSLEVTK